mmetsp:Transcript_51238/g.166100  ORF Transcript_51238/g.166100 Transcript_51238/m.166100 type:complete len:215 (+) Transcript_51238:322-966(+)
MLVADHAAPPAQLRPPPGHRRPAGGRLHPQGALPDALPGGLLGDALLVHRRRLLLLWAAVHCLGADRSLPVGCDGGEGAGATGDRLPRHSRPGAGGALAPPCRHLGGLRRHRPGHHRCLRRRRPAPLAARLARLRRGGLPREPRLRQPRLHGEAGLLEVPHPALAGHLHDHPHRRRDGRRAAVVVPGADNTARGEAIPARRVTNFSSGPWRLAP